MDLSNAYICPSPSAQLIVLFCMIWPFVAIGVVEKRLQSSAPFCAMLLPLAVTLLGTWIGITNVIQGMPISGAGVAASAAGFAEVLASLSIGALSAVAVGVVALIKRHRPVADRTTTFIAFVLTADTIAALLFIRFFSLEIASLVFVGMSIAGAIAIATAVWLFLVARKIVRPAPLPMAAPAIAVCALILGLAVWYQARSYAEIARHGITVTTPFR